MLLIRSTQEQLIMSSSGIVQSVNWHVISNCNYHCRFCFAQNLCEAPVSFDEGEAIIKKLIDIGMNKINFAGGEPLLHPSLLEYCRIAKKFGMTVSITTNGSLLNSEIIEKMKGIVDWIALSIDSGSNEIEARLGRGTGNHVTHCIQLSEKIRNAGFRLKINTTVTALTYLEDMAPLIRSLRPDRWKILQMLHIHGENDEAVDELAITKNEFEQFIDRHRFLKLDNDEYPVFETSDDIENSYFMITPSGNVKIDTGKFITKYPLDEVISQGVEVFVDPEKYQKRGGLYEWK